MLNTVVSHTSEVHLIWIEETFAHIVRELVKYLVKMKNYSSSCTNNCTCYGRIDWKATDVANIAGTKSIKTSK